MRTTLSDGNCDVWMDMASDTEGASSRRRSIARLSSSPIATTRASAQFKTLDDPRLEELRIGVFQVSAIRQALAQHGIMANTVIHYLSHNGDLVAENQPSYQIQQVIDGNSISPRRGGPMAGYYKTIKQAPLTIQPVNTIDDTRAARIRHGAGRAARPAGHQGSGRAGTGTTARPKSARFSTTLACRWSSAPTASSRATCPRMGRTSRKRPPKQNPRRPAIQTKTASCSTQLKELLAERRGSERGIRQRDCRPRPAPHCATCSTTAPTLTRALATATRRWSTRAFRLRHDRHAPVEHKADVELADFSHWTPLMYAAWNDDAGARQPVRSARARNSTQPIRTA